MFQFFEIGGKVRDELLGVQSKDVDFVAVPKEVDGDIEGLFLALSEHLREEGYEIFLETPSCYTIRAKFPKYHTNKGMSADFVLARKELGYKEGTREPIVVPGDLYDDMSRRDFTINAMAKREDGSIIDYFDGMKDLKNGVLRTPIDGKVTFQDDPLRLLRAIRFAITKDFIISMEIHDILHLFDYDSKFGVVSEERIREELYKCFRHNTLETLNTLNVYRALRDYVFKRTNLWLEPTNKRG